MSISRPWAVLVSAQASPRDLTFPPLSRSDPECRAGLGYRPIKPCDDHSVTSVDGFQEPLQLSAMLRRAANLLFEDLDRARFVQGGLLRDERLAYGADAAYYKRSSAAY